MEEGRRIDLRTADGKKERTTEKKKRKKEI